MKRNNRVASCLIFALVFVGGALLCVVLPAIAFGQLQTNGPLSGCILAVIVVALIIGTIWFFLYTLDNGHSDPS